MSLVDPFSPTLHGRATSWRDYVVMNLAMHPDQWAAYKNKCPLSWSSVRFSGTEIESVPDEHDTTGVYTLVLKSGIAEHPAACCLLYVGKVEKQSFRARFKQYLQERLGRRRTDRVKIVNALTKWDGYLWFYYSPVNDASQVHQLEEDLLSALLPPLNEQFPAVVRGAVKIMRG